MLKRATSIELWSFDSSNLNYQCLLSLKLNSPIITASISSKSQYIAYSTDTETAVFEITNNVKNTIFSSSTLPKLKKIATLPPSILVKFSEGA